MGDPIYNTLGFKYMDVIQLTPFSSFSICRKVQLSTYDKSMKPDK